MGTRVPIWPKNWCSLAMVDIGGSEGFGCGVLRTGCGWGVCFLNRWTHDYTEQSVALMCVCYNACEQHYKPSVSIDKQKINNTQKEKKIKYIKYKWM